MPQRKGKKRYSPPKQDAWQCDKTVTERMEYMLKKELGTDVVFRVSSSYDKPGDAKTIRAHSFMLISASPVFWAMFCGEMKEKGDVIVQDVEPKAFKEMLKFIYTDKADLTGFNVMQVLHAAKKYQLPSLVKLCIAFLESQLHMSSACTILDHSLFFEESKLAHKCIREIEAYTEHALSSEDFNNLSRDALSLILDSDKLTISELDLFEKTYEWATCNCKELETIRETLGECLYKIRFPIIPTKEFTEIVCPKNILSSDEQLEISKYIAAPTDAAKPSGFNCRSRTRPPVTRKGLPISNGQIVTVKKEGTYRAKGTPYKCGHFTIQPNTRLTVVLNTGTHVWVTQDKIKGRFEIPNEDIVLWSDVPSTLGSYLKMESCKLL